MVAALTASDIYPAGPLLLVDEMTEGKHVSPMVLMRTNAIATVMMGLLEARPSEEAKGKEVPVVVLGAELKRG